MGFSHFCKCIHGLPNAVWLIVHNTVQNIIKNNISVSCPYRQTKVVFHMISSIYLGSRASDLQNIKMRKYETPPLLVV